MAKVRSELTAYLKELSSSEIENQKRLDKTEMILERRWIKNNGKLFEDLKEQTLKGIMQLDSKNGLIESTARNIATIRKNKKLIKKITSAIDKETATFMLKEGSKLQELSIEQWQNRQKINEEYGIELDLSIPADSILKTALSRSIMIFDDIAGTYANEITNGLVRQIVAGTSRDKLVKEYEAIIPAIDKPKRGGGRYRLSAFERSLMTVRTELIRVFNDTTDIQAQAVLGKNYYVQNVNPMDRRTAAICMAASAAGVMKRDELIATYGLPSRHPRCRCSIAPIPDVIARNMDRKEFLE